ncbi:MAG: hypothetical protein JSW49_09710 [candidate division WOR-3 bacterium]|nr:MAG: hypothetical protein JSW49_09710 [candidate division WOR-3 bacterium]
MRSLAAEIIEKYSHHSFEEIHDVFEKEGGYVTPKAGMETTDCGFLALRELLELSQRRITFDQIEKIFRLRKERKTECD